MGQGHDEAKPGELPRGLQALLDLEEWQAAARGLTLDQLRGRLLRLAPLEFLDRPPPGVGVQSLDRAHRVKLLAKRAELGVGLWHPRDQVVMGEGLARPGRSPDRPDDLNAEAS